MNNELIISAYGSHNAAIAMYYNGNYTVIEVERWLNKKNAGMVNYMPSQYPQQIFDEICSFLLSTTDRSDVDLYLTNYHDLNKVKPKFTYTQHRRFDHHTAHAATSFYQSPYEDAITFTFDGGGDAGFFNVYRTDRRNGIELLERFNQDLGFAYMIIADYLEDITRDPLTIGNLVYAGKLMGLCSYGNVREEWIEPFTDFYEAFNYHGDSYLGGAEANKDHMPILMKKLGILDFDERKTRISGQLAWDMAATTQHVFEEQFFKFAQPYLDEYPELPITMSGGCALNVILNARILNERNGKIFVPPNPSDCGVAVGGILAHNAPESQVDLTYSGVPIMDDNLFFSYIENDGLSMVEDVSIKDLASFIHRGNIVGVVNGNSEHGPRALGNRSILCNPIGDMKDILNKKVKNREWYRPFAPVVRLQDADTYFHLPEGAQSRHMTFIAHIKEEYRDVIPAVTHEDGTGRIQTVTKQQNPFLYDIITEFSLVSDHAVLLNTSFNVNGKPILSRMSDALDILKTSEMDAVYYKGNLVFRRGEEENFTRNYISENIKPLDDTTTLYLLVLPTSQEEATGKHLPKVKDIIASHKDNVVLAVSTKYFQQFKDEFDDNDGVMFHEMGDNLLYYHEWMQEAVEGIDLELPVFCPYVRMLWAKTLMYKNYWRTKNHMFVTLDKVLDDVSVIHDIKLISSLAGDNTSDIIITKGEDYTGELSPKDIKRYSGQAVEVDRVPNFDIVWGSVEQIEWLSVNMEGQFLNLLRGGKAVKDIDYGIMTYLTNPDNFKVY